MSPIGPDADLYNVSSHFGYLGQSGLVMLTRAISGCDPEQTFQVVRPRAEKPDCGQINRLNRIHSLGLEHGGAGRAGQELD